MTEMVNIVLEERTEKGKEKCRKLRPAGYTPCVVYGPDYPESLPAKVKTLEIQRIANSPHWETMTVNMVLPNGKQEMGLLREVQKDFLNGRLLHLDFLQLVKGHKITVNVPVEIIGKESCPGVKLGGVVDQILREIEMEVLPGQIPDSLTVDVSALGLGQQVHVKDLTFPGDVSVLTEPEEVIVAIVIPRGVVEAETAAEEEPKEVEVLAKGKAKESEEEGKE